MRIALKSALMLTTRVIQIINPELHRHMQRTALIALTLAQRLELPDERQQTIFCAALLHDIGVLGDKRTIHSLDAIDNIHDPHQRQGVAMLEGLATFQPIVPFIRDHHFSPNHRGSREQHIVYFADAFERLLPADSQAASIYEVLADADGNGESVGFSVAIPKEMTPLVPFGIYFCASS